MKMGLTTLILLVFTICTGAQYIEISLKAKMNNASHIVEAEVVENHSFQFDQNIYTSHRLKVYKSFKEEVSVGDTLWVITDGGEIDGESSYPTHTLSLAPGQAGVFFLNRTDITPSEMLNSENLFFQVYAGEQGFLQYAESDTGLYAHDLFSRYDDIEKSLFQLFEKEFSKPRIELRNAEYKYMKH